MPQTKLPQLKELIAFIVGTGMVVHQTVFAPKAQTILVVAGIALMGVLGSGVAQRALKKLIEE
jgi:hypothetical protein